MPRRGFLTALGGRPAATARQDKVVYHFSEGLEQTSYGLRNIGNPQRRGA